MSFATEMVKSVSPFKVLINIDSIDGNYSGRFSDKEGTPYGLSELYEGRLISYPKISLRRDNSFFGILVYSASNIELTNTDGEFDSLIDDYNIIGATVRIYIGFDGINDYPNIFTGYIESVTITEKSAIFTIADLRKKLQTGNSVDIEFVDAIQGIENILVGNYDVTASSTYFDLTAWNAAKALAYDVVRIAPDNDTVSTAIEDCVKSTMGFFFIDGAGKYSYKMIDTAATSVTTINRYDIINETSVNYDSGNILGSASIKCPDVEDSHLYNFVQRIDAITFFSNGNMVIFSNSDSPRVARRSADYGKTYTSIDITASAIAIMKTFSPRDPEILMSLYGDGVRRSIDNASSWSVVLPYDVQFKIVDCGSGVISAISNNTGTSFTMHQSNDYGSTWSTVATIAGYTIDAFDYIPAISSFTVIARDATFGISSVMSILTSTSGASWNVVKQISGYESFTVTSLNHLSDNSLIYSMRVISGSASSVYLLRTDKDYNDLWSLYNSGGTSSQIGAIASDVWVDSFDNVYLLINYSVNLNIYRFYSDSIDKTNISQMTVIENNSYNTMFYDKYGKNIVYEKDITSGNNSMYFARFSNDNPYIINNIYKASTFSSYGIDTLKHFDTTLAFNSDATLLAEDLIQYFKDLHGEFSVTSPIKYYAVNVGDNVDVEIWRETTSFLGTKKCEVLSKTYDLKNAMITFDLRII